jgi:hypothetical protein
MSEHSETNLVSLLSPGGKGETPIDLRLNARELASIQYVLTIAADNGIFEAAVIVAAQDGLGARWAVAFQFAELRIGVAIARALEPERAAEFSALLAEIDQVQSALDHGEST